jgi:hypothetical protein
MLLVQAVETVTAQAELASWANLTATGIIGMLLVWIITKAFPQMLERHDAVQLETRGHFERVLNSIDSSRATSAKEGHDAAKQLSVAIDRSTEGVRENTKAVDGLTQQVISLTTIKPAIH